MAKITCDNGGCTTDTGYTEDTPVENMVRSFVPGAPDARGELIYCSTCWEELGLKTEFKRG